MIFLEGRGKINANFIIVNPELRLPLLVPAFFPHLKTEEPYGTALKGLSKLKVTILYAIKSHQPSNFMSRGGAKKFLYGLFPSNEIIFFFSFKKDSCRFLMMCACLNCKQILKHGLMAIGKSGCQLFNSPFLFFLHLQLFSLGAPFDVCNSVSICLHAWLAIRSGGVDRI